MGIWSAENATKAYLKTLKMGNKAKGPDVAEYISALAAGNNAQLMVVSCASPEDSTILALVAAAHQTGGRVVCILPGLEELELSKKILGTTHACHLEFVSGNAQELLLAEYKEAHFVLIDCNHVNYEEVHNALVSRMRETILVGYNAFCKGFWRSSSSKTQLLPIGGGLLVTRIAGDVKTCRRLSFGQKSQWVVKVDKCTGEEHVFRVRSPKSNQFEGHEIHTC